MNEFQCEACGAIYTLDAGNIPPSMACMCKSKSFKTTKRSKHNILIDAN